MSVSHTHFERGPSNSAVAITDSDFNYCHHPLNNNMLCYLPHYYNVKSWNCADLDIKCEGEDDQFKKQIWSKQTNIL